MSHTSTPRHPHRSTWSHVPPLWPSPGTRASAASSTSPSPSRCCAAPPLLLLITNNGARLGFQLAVTGLFGWLTLMFLFWVIFGIGYKGPTPAWRVIEVSTDTPRTRCTRSRTTCPNRARCRHPPATSRPIPRSTPQLAAQPKAPTLGDVVAANPEIATELSDKLNGWRIVLHLERHLGDAGGHGHHLPHRQRRRHPASRPTASCSGPSSTRAASRTRTNNSIVGRVAYRAEKLGMWLTGNNPTHYAVHAGLPQAHAADHPAGPAAAHARDRPGAAGGQRDHGAQQRRHPPARHRAVLRQPGDLLDPRLRSSTAATRPPWPPATRPRAPRERDPMAQYLPIVAMLVLAALFAGRAASSRRGCSRRAAPTAAKSAPYECGIVPEPASRPSASRCASTWWR